MMLTMDGREHNVCASARPVVPEGDIGPCIETFIDNPDFSCFHDGCAYECCACGACTDPLICPETRKGHSWHP